MKFQNNNKPSFIQIPNEYIKCDIKKEYKSFGIDRKFLLVYVSIYQNMSLNQESRVSISDILRRGDKASSLKPSSPQCKNIIKTLKYMEDINMVNIITDLSKVGYLDMIRLKVNNHKSHSSFTSLTYDEYSKIASIESPYGFDNILTVFLYVKSHIFKRSKMKGGDEQPEAYDKPEAFFVAINIVRRDLGMSKDTVSSCLLELVKNNILIKHEAKLYANDSNKDSKPLWAPNIYVLPNSHSDQEIEWALNKLKAMQYYNNQHSSKINM